MKVKSAVALGRLNQPAAGERRGATQVRAAWLLVAPGNFMLCCEISAIFGYPVELVEIVTGLLVKQA